ncbi:MAG: hypothetical protein AAF502_04180 [Bacteroidota bacterium]
MKIILYQYQSEGLKVEVAATINDDGDLIIEGYDIGDIVKELKGDLDYEYYLIVRKRDKKELLRSLNLTFKKWTQKEDKQLVQALDQKFAGRHAFSAIKQHLEKNDIPFDSFFWS